MVNSIFMKFTMPNAVSSFLVYGLRVLKQVI